MGKLLLRTLLVGIGLSAASRLFGRVASNVSGNFDWTVEKIQRRDLGVTIREGRVVGLIKIRVRILNRNPFSVFLQGYRAVISREGTALASVATAGASIELPSNEPRTIVAEFTIPGQEFVNQLRLLLAGESDFLAPIDIQGEVTLSNGIMLPINQRIEFFALT